MTIIDFRSDLLIPPTPEIKAAVAAALDEPPEFELRGGAQQAALEKKVASLLGKEDSLLFPTCTMANQAALILHCRQGDAAIAEVGAHMITSEAGAPASLAGAIVHGVPGDNGIPDVATVTTHLKAPANAIVPRVTALLLENTHLRSGGRVLDLDDTAILRVLADETGTAIHLDGARLFNAAVAAEMSLSDLASVGDTVSLSLNKSLGAPLGAMLAGPKHLIYEALRIRHRLGGGFRPTAMIAAAALAALESYDHIAEDHRRAKELAAALSRLEDLSIAPVETNIVFVSISRNVRKVIDKLEQKGVMVLSYGPNRIRLVTHRGINDDDIARTLKGFKSVLTN